MESLGTQRGKLWFRDGGVHCLYLFLTVHLSFLVEITFQICTSYHPALPEHYPLTGWFPCVTSGNGPQDEGTEQQGGGLEGEEEVWLKVSGPDGFRKGCKYMVQAYLCVHVCACMCVHVCTGMVCQEMSFCYPKVFTF